MDFGVTDAILPGSADIGHFGDGGLGDGTGRIGPIRPRADVLDVRRAAGTDKRDATRINADAIEPAVLDALASFYRDHYRLIADAVIRAQARHLAGKDNQRAELAAVEAELTKINQAIDRYLNAFENSTLEEEDLAASTRPRHDQDQAVPHPPRRARRPTHRRAAAAAAGSARPRSPTTSTS